MSSTRKQQARFAGMLYFLACIPAPFSLIYLPRLLIVHGNATTTATNILANETLFRIGMACELINAVAFLFVVLALYRLFEDVDKRTASLMVTLFAASIPISCLNVLNEVAALTLVRGADYLSVFTKPQADALAMVFLRLHSFGFFVGAIFWGLWLVPFGILVYKSGFFPRFLGVWLIVNCFGYVIPTFTAFVLPQFRDVVMRFAWPLLFGEMAIGLYLLIKGVRDQPLTPAVA